MQPSRGSRTSAIFIVLAVSAGLLSAACSENPVGRKCFIGLDAGAESQAVIASPALECSSRTCLHVPLERELPEGSEYSDLCTASCETDSDCDRVPESPCVNGFTCAIPVVVGPFCCRKQCICRDYLQIPDGGLPTPQACVPGVEGNTCCNLPGNENLEQCGGSGS
jgi:hypothetical protein